MLFKKNTNSDNDQRKYLRLDTVFPVEFRIMGFDGKTFLSPWMQGFTRNIARGGLCLEINDLDPVFAGIFKNSQISLSLRIEVPLSAQAVDALAEVAWVRNLDSSFNKYTIGLKYKQIDACKNNKIINYALVKKSFIPVVLAGIVILSLAVGLSNYRNYKLVEANKMLVEQFVRVTREFNALGRQVKQSAKDKLELQSKINDLGLRIKTVENEKEQIKKKSIIDINAAQSAEELSKTIAQLTKEKADSQNQLIALQQKESSAVEELSRLDKRKTVLQKANFDKMYHWLKVHQNPRTGLVLSFEGDNQIANWAFIYDQSLAAQAYMLFSDFDRAKKVLDFFLDTAKRCPENLFYNAYYANDAGPAEYTVHSGPNIWLGISAVHYFQKTEDKKYLEFARGIARAILKLQKQDKDGGIKGGPDTAWYSTEHNLDAYAFFGMLHSVTKQQEYSEARNKLLNWFILHAYDKSDIPVKRGKGDSTIATDTYAWSIASLGPKKLEEIDMNPEMILDFVEKYCVIEVDFRRPDGQIVKIKGFDFAPQANLSRGGVVSSEWTAQMALSFKITADFYKKKNMIEESRVYEQKANEYLLSLNSMVISSPSPSGQGDSCLPYATQENVDTGHGWRTPKGKYTGSVAGTVYTIFAHYGYNPLELGND